MNILVFSDSHGRVNKIRAVLEKQIKKPDAVIFFGDGLNDFDSIDLGNTPFYAVSGNCDRTSFFEYPSEPPEKMLSLCGLKIMITHGHLYSVKSGLSRLVYSALEKGADIVLFGHTHEKLELVYSSDTECFGRALDKDLYIMNPGSIGDCYSSWGNIEINKEGRVLLSHGEQ